MILFFKWTSSSCFKTATTRVFHILTLQKKTCQLYLLLKKITLSLISKFWFFWCGFVMSRSVYVCLCSKASYNCITYAVDNDQCACNQSVMTKRLNVPPNTTRHVILGSRKKRHLLSWQLKDRYKWKRCWWRNENTAKGNKKTTNEILFTSH